MTRLACLLADLPVELIGRLRCDRVMHLPAPPRTARARAGGRPSTGAEFALPTRRPGPSPRSPPAPRPPATAPRSPQPGTGCTRGSPTAAAWLDHDGELPVIEGTLIRLQVDHLPGDRDPKPVWLWSSRAGAAAAEVDRCWQAFLRRFDLEHTFRLFKQTLGWTRPKLRDPAAADRWTWLVIAAHTQLRLARPPGRRPAPPWERPAPPGRLTPARVRRGFRRHPREDCLDPPVHRNPASPAPAGRPARRTSEAPRTNPSASRPKRTQPEPAGNEQAP